MSRPRLVTTQAGDIELRIPKLRRGSFFPATLEPRRRIDQALNAVVIEAYVNGVSTRAVDDLVTALGIESGSSKSEVSRICPGVDEQVEAFRSRPLHQTSFPYVFSYATYLHVRRAGPTGLGQVTSMKRSQRKTKGEARRRAQAKAAELLQVGSTTSGSSRTHCRSTSARCRQKRSRSRFAA